MTRKNCKCCDERISDLEGKITTLTMVVDSLQNALTLKVDKNEVIASVNLSDERIRIQGSKIMIDNETIKTNVTP